MLALMTYNVSTILLLMALIIAVWTDVMHNRIPNLLSLGGAVLGLSLQSWALGTDGLLAGLGGLSIGLLIFLPFYALGGMGAGDVKLMAAVGTFLGPLDTLWASAFTLMAGGLLGVLVLLLRRGGMVTLRRYGSILKCLLVTGRFSYVHPTPGEAAATRFPYALAIATGAITVLWWLSYLSRLPMMLNWF